MSEILQTIFTKIEHNKNKVDQFFAQKLTNSLFYNSIDLRHSGFKIAPVDVNCYPAGFNNLSDESKKFAVKVTDDFLKKNYPNAKKIAILPENHTRNFKYLENVLALRYILENQGLREVRVLSLIEEIDQSLEIDLENGQKIIFEKLTNQNNQIVSKSGFVPDLIIANNDFTGGVPEVLNNVSQDIIPSTNLGWHVRRKSHHFDIYNQIATEFASLIDLDPWLISSMHRHCKDVNFKEQYGLPCVAKYVDELITKLKEKYQQYGIKEDPYCYIKADNGTYGMSIMTVKSGEEVLEINKKERNKMNAIKGSIQNRTAIIQEGILTIDKIKHMIAEPMIYMMAGEVVGNLFRANDSRDDKISLNSAGMSFYDLRNLNEEDLQLGLNKSQISLIYSTIAKLSALAASMEKYYTKT